MGRILFISGTGTDVGKTALSLAVLLWARARGYHAGYLKPVQCGTFAFGEAEGSGRREGGDADWIRELSGGMETHVTCRLRLAASPHLAAEREGVKLDLGLLQRDAQERAEGQDLLILEGAGGAAVPLDRRGATLSDLAAGLSAEALLACAPGLGTLHHTLTTVEYLRARSLRVAGFAFCARDPHPDDLAADNSATLSALTGLPFFGLLPHSARIARGLAPSAQEAATWIAPLTPSLDAWWNRRS